MAQRFRTTCASSNYILFFLFVCQRVRASESVCAAYRRIGR
jgi:hypothetical protein